MSRIPSVKTIATRLNIDQSKAEQVRNILESYVRMFPFSRPTPIGTFRKVSEIIGGFGLETIPRGRNSKSPRIDYVNMGDTYSPTVLFVNGSFRIGAWGDIVERGNYE